MLAKRGNRSNLRIVLLFSANRCSSDFNNRLRYQCTPKLTILPNFSYSYSQVHLIEFFQLQKVLRKMVSFRQSYNEKTILWIYYLYLEAVNKLSWSIRSAIKSHVKKPNLPIVSKYSRKNHSTANRSIYTCPIFPKKRSFVFSKQFWVAAAPFKRSSPSMLSVFTKYIPALYGDMPL